MVFQQTNQQYLLFIKLKVIILFIQYLKKNSTLVWIKQGESSCCGSFTPWQCLTGLGEFFFAKGNKEIPVPALSLPCSFWHQLCLPAAGEQGKQPMLERWLQNKWRKKHTCCLVGKLVECLIKSIQVIQVCSFIKNTFFPVTAFDHVAYDFPGVWYTCTKAKYTLPLSDMLGRLHEECFPHLSNQMQWLKRAGAVCPL